MSKVFDDDSFINLFPGCGVSYHFGGNFAEIHSHTYWEFIFVLDELQHSFGNEIVRFRQHTVCVIKPGQSHSVLALDNENFYNHVVICITDVQFRKLCDGIDPDLYRRMQGTDYARYRGLLQREADIFLFLIDKLNVTNMVGYLQNMFTRQIILQIISALMTDSSVQNGKKNEPIPDPIMQMIYLMRSPESFQTSLAKLFLHLNYSYKQLTRLFLEYTGRHVKEYFIDTKLSYACNLLKTTNKPIAIIANAIGLTNCYFSNLFLKKYGCSPYQFRKNSANNLLK
jgi:AraC-like DNA-binding protein